MTNANTKFKVLGCNDEVTDCGCCGKSGLKKTVILESEATGIVRYGVDCAARAMGYSGNGARKQASLLDSRGKLISRAAAFLQAGHSPEKVKGWIGGQGYGVETRTNPRTGAVNIFVLDVMIRPTGEVVAR